MSYYDNDDGWGWLSIGRRSYGHTHISERPILWTDKFGVKHNVRTMEIGHMQNCAILLTHKQADCTEFRLGKFYWDGRTADEWIYIFRKELKRRGVI